MTEELVRQAASRTETAIVILGRTAGEDRDNQPEPGSYLLTQTEEALLEKVTSAFSRVIVLLNVGNIIDMRWVETYRPAAVMYIWQGGQEGGNAVADVLVGSVTPSGKLSDTIAWEISDYPSTGFFGGKRKNIYWEDIYVGYRYFSTFAGDKVQYPFGFGLSYTSFAYKNPSMQRRGEWLCLAVTVKNIGHFPGKEVLQVYGSAPQGRLSKPERVLAAYGKTRILAPGEEERLEITFHQRRLASFDDAGVTNFRSCFLLERGTYILRLCTDVRTEIFADSFLLDRDQVIERCHSVAGPVHGFAALDRTVCSGPDTDYHQRVPGEILQSGGRGIQLKDVKAGTYLLEEFIAQLTDEELASIAFGEGMNSPKVTAGTGCAFGGVTRGLLQKGIPLACGTDASSGLRMDSGATATSLPNSTLLACTWNEQLVQTLYEFVSLEMCENNIDVLLGPGVNIHRNPLNGRNFEYYSEDPVLSGTIAAAVCRGIAAHGNTATVKHFCCNNQESNRHVVDSVLSERAMREIYLKPFEIVLRSGDACKAVMTSYNPVNSTWAAGNYGLNTMILREEWGFRGFVMSDWWARTGDPEQQVRAGTAGSAGRDYVPAAVAQNDIYMVVTDAADYAENNLLGAVKSGRIPRGVLQRNAMNICRFLMGSRAMDRQYAVEETIKIGPLIAELGEMVQDVRYAVTCEKAGNYVLRAVLHPTGSELSQATVIFYGNGLYKASFTLQGAKGESVTRMSNISLTAGTNWISVKIPKGTLSVTQVQIMKSET